MIEDERVEVRRYLPAVRRRRQLLGVLAFVVAISASFRFGQLTAVDGHNRALREASRWQEKAMAQRQQLLRREQMLANFERGSAVDKRVIEEVRGALREARETMTGLEQEIAFYKGLMDPEAEISGLDIRGFDLRAKADTHEYEFRLVLQQVARSHPLITGYAMVKIVGHDQTGERSFSLHQLSDEVLEEKISLRFRYFQTIEGTLRLPEGFEPRQLQLVARSGGRRSQKAEKLIDWGSALST